MALEAKQGKDVILLYRLLKKETQEAAWKLAFQTEHSNGKTKSFDTVTTKDGPIGSPGEVEYELSATSIVANGDPHIEEMDQAFDDDEIVEVWEIDKAEKGTEENAEKYKAKYLQAYITGFNPSANADDNVELELEFGVLGRAKKGYATLTKDQAEVVQYVFKDTVKATEPEETE